MKDFEKWLKDNNLFQYEDDDYADLTRLAIEERAEYEYEARFFANINKQLDERDSEVDYGDDYE